MLSATLAAGLLLELGEMRTLLPMSGTSSAAMAAALVTTGVLDARPARGSCATEKVGLPSTGLDTSADCMAAAIILSSHSPGRAISPNQSHRAEYAQPLSNQTNGSPLDSMLSLISNA